MALQTGGGQDGMVSFLSIFWLKTKKTTYRLFLSKTASGFSILIPFRINVATFGMKKTRKYRRKSSFLIPFKITFVVNVEGNPINKTDGTHDFGWSRIRRFFVNRLCICHGSVRERTFIWLAKPRWCQTTSPWENAFQIWILLKPNWTIFNLIAFVAIILPSFVCCTARTWLQIQQVFFSHHSDFPLA